MSLVYTVTVFKELVESFSDWLSLRNYLESEEGGHLRVVDQKEEDHLALIRYEKGVSHMNLPHVRWFRSVVWDTLKNRPVSVSPPHAMETPVPEEQCGGAGWVCEEFLDGFMINGYRRLEESGWSSVGIATRSKLDASGTFYSPKTFRTLFMEAYGNANDLDRDIVATVPSSISVGYSFLVQHPENRGVTPVNHARTVLIQRTSVDASGNVLIEDHFKEYRGASNMDAIDHVLTGNGSFEERLHALFSEKSWAFQGVVVKDGLGNRWKYRTDKYLQVKALRGNQPNTLNRYAYLYTQNLTHTYLEYYPEDSFSFSFHQVCVKTIVDRIYQLYLLLHVRKQIAVDRIDKMYHPHLYGLHKMYVTKLRPSGRHLTETDVYTYFHGQPWQRIAFLIRKTQDSYFSEIENMMEVSSP